jgi:hypothetical protein
MSDDLGNPTPQFDTAEYAGKPESNRCRVCQQPIGGTYYRVNTAMVCPGCVEKIRGEMSLDTHAAYLRALAHGVGAAAVGLVGYALLAILLQGWVISFMSVGVGWIVGTAMMKGSNAAGGRRYQITAAVLTYAAVSMAAIPIWMHFAPTWNRQKLTQEQRFEEEERRFGQGSGQQQPEAQPAPRANGPRMSLGTWMGRAAVLGLASPLIQLTSNPGWGAMGLLILFYGIRIAWKITAGRPFEVYGPFADSPPASP